MFEIVEKIAGEIYKPLIAILVGCAGYVAGILIEPFISYIRKISSIFNQILDLRRYPNIALSVQSFCKYTYKRILMAFRLIEAIYQSIGEMEAQKAQSNITQFIQPSSLNCDSLRFIATKSF